MLSELRSLRASLPQPRSGLAQALPSQPAPAGSRVRYCICPSRPHSNRSSTGLCRFPQARTRSSVSSPPPQRLLRSAFLRIFRRGPRFGARRPSLKASLLPLEFPEKAHFRFGHTHTHPPPCFSSPLRFHALPPSQHGWGTQQQRDSPFFLASSAELFGALALSVARLWRALARGGFLRPCLLCLRPSL